MSEALPRDAHLRAALRHAPDRALDPPAALSREILAAARAAVAPPPWPRRVRAKAAALFDALRRPAAGAAFASLVLATVIGLMWRDGPPPEADAPPRPQAAAAEQRAEMPPGAAAPASTAAAVPAAATEPPAPTRKPATPTPRPRETAAPPAEARPALKAPAAPAIAAAPADAATPRAETADAAAENVAGIGAMQQSAVPATRAAPDPLAPAIAALDPARDATGRDALRSADGAPAPRADPLRHWLADLQRSTRGRWVASDSAPAGPATPVPGREGVPLGQVFIGVDAAWWQGADAGAGWWRAPLPAAELQRLRAGLAGWSTRR